MSTVWNAESVSPYGFELLLPHGEALSAVGTSAVGVTEVLQQKEKPMSTKNNPGPFDCYANAEPDEPMFVLLGRDRHAAALVMLWLCMRRIDGPTSALKIAEAEACAEAMTAWRATLGHDDVGGIVALAQGLTVLAELVGAVITMEQQPLLPLAMGHYSPITTVRLKRVPAA